MSKRITTVIPRELFVLEDEDNPRGSNLYNVVPSTILDQVYDQLSPTMKTLREIIEDLRQEIITGGRGNIKFPVTTVNGKEGDVILTKNDLGLGRVDNTRDIDKPLSVPQRETIMDILHEYDFNVNFSDFYDHIKDMNNPHAVTFDQLNVDNDIDKLIQHYVSLHNYSTSDFIHTDIRRNLMKLWTRVDELDEGLEDRIGSVLACMDEHIEDINAHYDLFNKKEDISNKVQEFALMDNNDHTKYPSTRAVISYVTSRLVSFKKDELPDVQDWISNIKVINNRDELPSPTSRYFRTAYFIRKGNNSFNEIAICRMNEDGKTYSWDISDIGSYSKFNNKEFLDTPDGLSINMRSVVDAILSENGTLDTTLSEVLEDYYTKREIDNMHCVTDIKILPGTMLGTIRYYINDNMDTMSDDIKVAGLKRLAYLEWISENELKDNSVRSNHILSNCIESRHLKDKSVLPSKLTCRWGYLLGNTTDSLEPTAQEIKLTELADTLRPLIGGWPDPSTPGGNPYYDAISDMILHPHRMVVGQEYDLGDKSYARRYKGTISVIPNMDIKTTLSLDINIKNGYRIIEAGGAWCYQSDPEEWTILGGSNITGHTFATVTMSKERLCLESISTGDRMNAEYDIWVKYVKIREVEDAQPM